MERLRIPYGLPTAADTRAAIAANEKRLEERNRDPAVQPQLEEAMSQARAAARLLREGYGATRVRLYGSLARRDTDVGFDVDLAVEGIESRRFFSAWAAAAGHVTRELDLVHLGDAHELLRRRIEEDGVDLL